MDKQLYLENISTCEEIHLGTKENIEKSKEEFGILADKFLKILTEYYDEVLPCRFNTADKL